ncbi:hypothetical protein CANARDRAFT_194251 [[Candida] arabinofermentans NRRL YB-2248]|uniref:VPS10 domain-containing protein n=1 Tax=[Candida] arabinofermentans NRRL YB-2248 TaxID=983967 RepID=A0A1E4T6X5_9ASCO|nr:hypothetical protein CANARDRAFT_194251 [[Candida] arabinofermentans NRRL YB-2248]
MKDYLVETDIILQRDSDGDYDDDDDDSENPDEREGSPENSKEGENDGKVKTSMFTFRGTVKDYIYLEKKEGDTSNDETLMALTSQNEVFVTHNQGYSWEEVAPDDEFLGIYLNKYNPDHVYLLAANDKVVYSRDKGDNWKSFRTPCKPVPGTNPLYFHPTRPNYMIFYGQVGCDDAYSKACRTAAYVTRSYGKRWLKLQEHVKKCQFLGGLQKKVDPDYIVCEKESTEATSFKSNLVASKSWFEKERTTMLENVVGFVQAGDYLVAATVIGQDELRVHVSTDGSTWNEAFFPPNFHVDKQQAYTTLSGATKSIFLHITTNPRQNTEFGAILKSNSDGVSYVLSLENVNRDGNGYVDFEQMSGLEGVIVVNVVSNPKDAKRGARKQLKSMITHNDGAQWSLIQPPYVDADGNKFACSGKPLEDCSLHLHGYTEREDYRDTFSSQSAIGMMMAVGNVGEKLENYYDGHTYLTKDGGNTWKEVKKGVYMWEYGDQGSVIVIVNGKDNTNILSYSVDEGDTWTDYKFTDESVTVQDISTVPGDNSLKFLLFTRVPLARGDKTRVFQIDFSQLLKEPCNMDLKHPDIDDFELWTPKHPFQSDNCLFGHEMQYYRKIPGKLCRIGKALRQPYKVIRDCACTRQDYECDYNYYRDADGICRLIPGSNPPSHEDICYGDTSPIQYFKPTGYRRIPLSTCVGGKEFDKSGEPIPCKGKEDEFFKEHPGPSWVLIVFTWVVIVSVVAFFVKFAYMLYQTRYGEIRLDDEGSFTVIEHDGNLIARLKTYTESVLVTTLAIGSQGIRNSFINIKNLSKILKSKITGVNYVNIDAYTVSDDDIDQLDREQQERIEEQSLYTQFGDAYSDEGEPLFSDEENDLGTSS